MSVTVSDLLKLPSLRQAKILGGVGGLKKVVSSISVLEATDPSSLVDELFPHGKYSGSEIVITGFLHCVDDVDRQCSNLRRLIDGGEVGLVLYYVGIYLPKVDQKLIDIADSQKCDLFLAEMCFTVKHIKAIAIAYAFARLRCTAAEAGNKTKSLHRTDYCVRRCRDFHIRFSC